MLWFKNLMVYRLSRDVSLRAEEMEKQLAAYTFSPCGSQDMAKTGWVPPMGSQSDALTHASSTGQIIVCARKEEKILPTPVVKQALEAKILKLEAEQGRKLKKTEKDSLKDEVLHSLLPRAFSRFSQTMMWIDTVNGLIMVDCASAKKAEDTLALLRKSIGSLPVVPLALETPIELTLTEWVRSGAAAQGFQILDEAELKALLEDGGVIRAKKQDLVSDEIAVHIQAGARLAAAYSVCDVRRRLREASEVLRRAARSERRYRQGRLRPAFRRGLHPDDRRAGRVDSESGGRSRRRSAEITGKP